MDCANCVIIDKITKRLHRNIAEQVEPIIGRLDFKKTFVICHMLLEASRSHPEDKTYIAYSIADIVMAIPFFLFVSVSVSLENSPSENKIVKLDKSTGTSW